METLFTLMILLELGMLFPIGVALYGVIRWRGNWRSAAAMPMVFFIGLLILLEMFSEQKDITNQGIIIADLLCASMIIYYIVLLVRRVRFNRATKGAGAP